MAPSRCLTWWDGYFWVEVKERMWFCVAWGVGFQSIWGLSASLSLPILLFSSPLPSLSCRRREDSVETIHILFSPSQSCQCGKGDRTMPLDCTVLSVESRHRQEPTPHPKPCSWTLTHVKPNTAVSSVDAGPQHTVVFPSRRGYQVTGTSWQSLLVILALVTTCWPKRDQYSLNKSCLNQAWVSRCC